MTREVVYMAAKLGEKISQRCTATPAVVFNRARPNYEGHCQVDARSAQLWLDGEHLPFLLVGTRHLIPHAERTGSQRPVVNRSEQVTADTEEVLHESVYREKPLRVRGGFESTHLSLALARRLMRDLRSIVLVLPGVANDGRHDRAVGRRIAAQLVRDQTVGRPALSFQDLAKEAHRGPAVAPRLDQDVEEVAVLVDGPPEILSSATHAAGGPSPPLRTRAFVEWDAVTCAR